MLLTGSITMDTDFENIDNGWAWIVLLSGFGNFVIIGFVALTSGLISTALLATYGEDLSKTSMAASLLVGTANCIGK